jgi:hypothetical protein
MDVAPGKYTEVHNSFVVTGNHKIICQLIAQRARARSSVLRLLSIFGTRP